MASCVAVTGASGFVGQHVCAGLLKAGYEVRALTRNASVVLPQGVDVRVYADWASEGSLDDALAGVQGVVHLAGRAHVMKEPAAGAMEQYRRVNVDFTTALVAASMRADVGSVVFASSVKAMGESSRVPLVESMPAMPEDPYGLTKLEAERVVLGAAESGRVQSTVLRLPLVYGPGMRANMLRLFELVDRGVPLPFGAIRNRRSIIYVGNVVAAIVATLESPAAAGEVFLVRDQEDVSTPMLVRAVAHALERRTLLVPVPMSMFHLAARTGDLLGRVGIPAPGISSVARLLGSLTVDDAHIRRTIGFVPPVSLTAGMAATAKWFRSRRPPA